MKTVIAGDKYDGPDYFRLKLHEEYGRVWLYEAYPDGKSKARILCIDDDGTLRIAADHICTDGRLRIKLPIKRRAGMKHDRIIIHKAFDYE